MNAESETKQIADVLQMLCQAVTGGQPEFVVATAGASVAVTVIPKREDYGKMCGQSGVIIAAFQKIADSMGKKAGRNVHFELERPEGCQRSGPRLDKTSFDVKWMPEQILPIMRSTCELVFERPVKIESATASPTKTLFSISSTDPKAAEKDGGQIGLPRALKTVFIAIGGSQGRSLIIDIERTEPDEALAAEVQPVVK